MPLKICLCFLILTSFNAFPQFKYQVYTEAGSFSQKNKFQNSGDETSIINNIFLTRLNGEVKYDYKDNNRKASILINVRPEIYGINNPQNIFKAKAGGNYFQYEETFSWGINISRQRNIYNLGFSNFNYDMFFLTGETELNMFQNLPLMLNIGYAFQDVDSDFKQFYDIIFIDIKLSTSLFSLLNTGYGIYIEKFKIENKLNLPLQLNIEVNNEGYRWGPKINLNYLREFVFNIDYNFLFHSSKFTNNLSYEQVFRFTAGIIFLSDFSAFLLVDYYKSSLKVTENYTENISPLYVPLNLENKVYLKLGYDLSSIIELYVKTGYLKENLYNDYVFSGWHLLLGFQIRN